MTVCGAFAFKRLLRYDVLISEDTEDSVDELSSDDEESGVHPHLQRKRHHRQRPQYHQLARRPANWVYQQCKRIAPQPADC